MTLAENGLQLSRENLRNILAALKQLWHVYPNISRIKYERRRAHAVYNVTTVLTTAVHECRLLHTQKAQSIALHLSLAQRQSTACSWRREGYSTCKIAGSG